MSPEREDPAAGPGLEGRLKRLDQIVSALEADDLELERALALFEEGVAHVRAAEKMLAEAELKVEELLQGDRTRPLPTPDP
jgi:exodeoxyribonuclease VII small subunit